MQRGKNILFILMFEPDTKSIEQTHTSCTRQIDYNKHRTFCNGAGYRTTGLQQQLLEMYQKLHFHYLFFYQIMHMTTQ